MKRTLFLAAGVCALALTIPAQAHWNFNIDFGCRPHVYVRPRPVYYVQEPIYCAPAYYTPCYPVYQPAVVHYVDHRAPEVAIMQDGFNMMFNAMSHPSNRSHRSHHRRR